MTREGTDLTNVVRIAQKIQLLSVTCRDLEAKRLLELSKMPGDLCMGINHKATGIRELDKSQIVVSVSFSYSASTHEETEEPIPIVDAKATLALRYEVDPEFLTEITPEQVQEFAQVNGVFHAWPYWRELLQNLTGRLGLPGIVAPVYRVFEKKAAAEQAAEN